MKIKRKIFYFNIVEVALALAIVGIGIAGIMALFPVSLNASRDSIGDNMAPDIAEQFINYIELQSRRDWTILTNPSHVTLYIYNDSGTDIVESETAVPDDMTWDTPIANTNFAKSTKTGNAKGIWKVQLKTNNIVDFSAIVRIWKKYSAGPPITSISDLNFNNAATPVPLDYAASIIIEVSWPSERPYSQREKRYYNYQFFNSN